MLPTLIKNENNFGYHKVSLEGEKVLLSNYNIPMLLFGKDERDKLDEWFIHFALLRKEIHLMFDQICNYHIILEVFKNRENLLLKEIFLSLHDIEEIYNKELVNFLEDKI